MGTGAQGHLCFATELCPQTLWLCARLGSRRWTRVETLALVSWEALISSELLPGSPSGLSSCLFLASQERVALLHLLGSLDQGHSSSLGLAESCEQMVP